MLGAENENDAKVLTQTDPWGEEEPALRKSSVVSAAHFQYTNTSTRALQEHREK